MHATSAKPIDKDIARSASSKISEGASSSGDQDQVNFSLDHWKMAFKDASERLCPVRADGHECGCLPMLARMVNSSNLFLLFFFCLFDNHILL